MADLRVDMFVEDRAHEDFVRPLIAKLLREKQIVPLLHSRCALGGHGRMKGELQAFQKALKAGQLGLSIPDLLVVATDTNCSTYTQTRNEIARLVDGSVFPIVAIACPDPHIERWYMADPESFVEVVGAEPRPGRRKCRRDLYKRKLADAVRRGGNPATLGGIEFAAELVQAMNLQRACRNESSLRHFVETLHAALTRRTQQAPQPDPV